MSELVESLHDWQDIKSYIAIFIFMITWFLILKHRSSHSVIAILGCGLMVLFDIVTPKEVSDSICGETILLVAAFMIIHEKLEQRGFIEILKRGLLYGKPSPLWLLARVSFLSGLLAALIMDNGAVTFLSPLVFRLCDENRLEIEPFMLALATSANIGSMLTVIGSVKNMIIVETSANISFFGFFVRMTPVVTVGLLLNTIFLMFYYRKRFTGRTVKPYRPPKNVNCSPTLSADLLSQNVAPDVLNTASREIPNSRITESAYDSDEDDIAIGMMSDGDERDENSDLESNDDESQHSEEENSRLLARKRKSNLARPQFANEFSSSPDRMPTPRNYAFEHTVYMNDGDRDSTSPWVIRRESHNRNPRQNQPVLTRFAWDAPNPESGSRGLQGIGLNLQKRAEQFIDDTKIFFGNGSLWKNAFFITIMFGMYLVLFFERSLGWAVVTVAALLLLFDGKNATNIINKINWGLVVYLIGMFGVMRGLYTTPIPDSLWHQYEERFIKPDVPNLSMSIFSLLFMSTLLTLILSSVPAILLILPYIPNIIDVRLRVNAVYLLAWNVVLIGNLSARISSAGLIVSEIAKDHLFDTPLVRPYEFKVWGKYSVWSTLIISIVGTLMISSFL